jgi:hypothetical protein
MTDLSEDSLEALLTDIGGNASCCLKPTKLVVHPSLYRKVWRLLHPGHYKSLPQWRYLVRRGARRA